MVWWCLYDFRDQVQVKGLPFNRYSWLTTHNSFARLQDKSVVLAPVNQQDSVTSQLNVSCFFPSFPPGNYYFSGGLFGAENCFSWTVASCDEVVTAFVISMKPKVWSGLKTKMPSKWWKLFVYVTLECDCLSPRAKRYKETEVIIIDIIM